MVAAAAEKKKKGKPGLERTLAQKRGKKKKEKVQPCAEKGEKQTRTRGNERTGGKGREKKKKPPALFLGLKPWCRKGKKGSRGRA